MFSSWRFGFLEPLKFVFFETVAVEYVLDRDLDMPVFALLRLSMNEVSCLYSAGANLGGIQPSPRI